MRRRGAEHDLSRAVAPIRVGRLTFRTLHGFDRRKYASADRLVTISLPAIEGETHKMTVVREIEL